MTTTELTRKQQKAADMARATEYLEQLREHFANGGILYIVPVPGTGERDYFRVYTASRITGHAASLTWAIGVALGYSLRDRGGQWNLAIDGGNYSKQNELALALGSFYAGQYTGRDALPYQTL